MVASIDTRGGDGFLGGSGWLARLLANGAAPESIVASTGATRGDGDDHVVVDGVEAGGDGDFVVGAAAAAGCAALSFATAILSGSPSTTMTANAFPHFLHFGEYLPGLIAPTDIELSHSGHWICMGATEKTGGINYEKLSYMSRFKQQAI